MPEKILCFFADVWIGGVGGGGGRLRSRMGRRQVVDNQDLAAASAIIERKTSHLAELVRQEEQRRKFGKRGRPTPRLTARAHKYDSKI